MNTEKMPLISCASMALSHRQLHVWQAQQLDPNNPVFNVSCAIRIDGNITTTQLKDAYRQLLQRHPILTGVVQTHDDEPCIQLGAHQPLITTHCQAAQVTPYCQLSAEQVIDINQSLFELHLVDTKDNWVIVFKGHHLICDQWSLQLIVSDFLSLVEQAFDGIAIDLPQVDYPELLSQSEAHAIEPTPAALEARYPVDFFPLAKQPGDIQAPHFAGRAKLDDLQPVFETISSLSNELSVSRFSVVLSSVLMTLYRITGLSELTVGIPVARRNRKNRYQVGHFVDLAAVSVTDLDTATPQQLLQTVSEKITDFLFGRNQFDMAQVNVVCNYLPLLNIKGIKPGLLPIIAGLPGHKLTLGQQGNITVSGVALTPSIAQYDLEFTLFEAAQTSVKSLSDNDSVQLIRKIIGANKLFDATDLARIGDIHHNYLAQFKENLTRPIADLDVLSAQEKHQLLVQWNETSAPFPEDKTLAELFEQQVAKTPENIAVIFEQTQLSYQALNDKANQLAHCLRDTYLAQHGKDLPADTLIAVYVERSIEMMVAILGILKAGAAYVPISPQYPQARTQFILEDTKAPFVLTQTELKSTLTALCNELAITPTIVIPSTSLLDEYPTENLSLSRHAKELAYVIYTSGTTGQPKGVMLEHQAVVNRIHWMQKEYLLDQKDVVLQKTPYIFDVSVWELFWPHWIGATMIIASPEIHKEPEKLINLIVDKSITTIHFVPSMLSAFCQEIKRKGDYVPTCLTKVFCSGEALISQHVDDLVYRAGNSLNLHNLYGPTEAAIDVTYANCTHLPDDVVPIGAAIDNIKLYVLGANLQPVPIGSPGELYIGGAGLARGYLNRDDLTQARFINDPFATDEDKQRGYTRLYKTGDLVRYRQDGTLVYLGRNDFQVKIRGYRIELGEIETALCQLEDVSQAVVLGYPATAPTALAAYIVPHTLNSAQTSELTLDNDLLLQALRAQLPDYMLPDSFTPIASLPLTLNGKLDRNALPEPLVMRQVYVAPRNATEHALCDIWQAVLETPQVGIHDNFFSLGGNSISAIKLISASRTALKCDIPLTLLFEHKTIAGIVAHLDNIELIDIPKVAQSQPVLSFAQERLLFIERYEQGTSAYHIPMMVKLNRETDLVVMEQALNQLLQLHPVLQTHYQENEQGYGYQAISDERLYISHVDCLEQQLVDEVKANIARPFDLSQALTLRVCAYHCEQNDYLLMLCHHIAFDGWSIDIFMRDLNALYQLIKQGDKTELAAFISQKTDIDYTDYAFWQREYLQGDKLTSLLDYWQNQLAGYETLSLTTDYARPSEFDYRGADIHFTFDAKLSEQLRALAKRQQTTLYSVMLSGFYLALSSLSGQTDIVIGTPSDNRHHAQTQDLVGFFVNSLVLRASINPQESIQTLIQQVHQTVLAAKMHQDLPFERLVEALDVERDPARHPIFQVMFSVQSFGEVEKSQNRQENAPFEPIAKSLESDIYNPAKFDLDLMINDSKEQLSGILNYAQALYSKAGIQAVLKIFENSLRALVLDSKTVIREVDLVDQHMKTLLLRDFQPQQRHYSSEQTLYQLFEVQVAQTPNNTALIFEEEKITYHQLDTLVTQVASCLHIKYEEKVGETIGPDTLIPLYFEPSIEMIVAILAVLKVGAAYVPISPDYPQERTYFILEDIKASILLTQSSLLEKHLHISQLASVSCLSVNDFNTSHLNTYDTKGKANNLAYVIYTSGTTGKPKGVMIEHRSLANLIFHNIDYYGVSSPEVVAFLARNYTFDTSIEQMFLALLTGSSLLLCDTQDQENMLHRLEQHQVTHIDMTASLINALDLSRLTSLKRIVSGGEETSINLARKYKNLLINEYGPTEVTVASHQYKCMQLKGNLARLPIGKPVTNLKHFVLDSYNKLAPIGAVGELYLGGLGVARGYFNRTKLNTEKFIINPFKSDNNSAGLQRLYKTGDLVRMLPNGHVEYLGRNDQQVKIRGYRIELGEIEKALEILSSVKQAVVVVRKNNGSKSLAAYLVMHKNSMLNQNEITGELSQNLPNYMLPTSFTVIESIPLTINGKLAHKALPEPELAQNGGFIAAETALEKDLVTIWQDVLSAESIGIEDNFFQIGGDSIVSIQLVSKIRKLGYNVPVKAIFDAPTIKQLASMIENKLDENKYTIVAEQGVLVGKFDLLPIQSWFFNQDITTPNHWNQAFMLKIPEDIATTTLNQALNALAIQHDMLRATFDENLGQPNQCYHDNIEETKGVLKQLNVEHLTKEQINTQLTLWQSSLNYENGPLWYTARLYGYLDGCDRLLMVFHHLIIDAVSWRIIAEDLESLVKGSSLGDKSSSYRQWVSAIQKYPEMYTQESLYWQNILDDQNSTFNLGKTNEYHFKFSEQDTVLLLNKAHLAYNTDINDLLLTALTLALPAIFNSSDSHVLMEGHGRENIANELDLTRTVGWFTSLYPLKLSEKNNLKNTLIHTKEMLRNVPNKGVGFGPLYQSNKVAGELPKICFNYLGVLPSTTAESQQASWAFIDEPLGETIAANNQSDLLLDINGLIQENCLKFKLSSRLEKHLSSVFVCNFKSALKRIIDHTCNINHSDMVTTPSDYNVEGLSIEHLERLKNEYSQTTLVELKPKSKKKNIIEI